ncbi:hypothetical protein J6590_106540, partial [Homalodisca vitripennis]
EMGRKSKKRLSLSERNAKNISERWKSVNSGDTLDLGLGLGCSVSEPVPNTETNEDTSDEDGPVTKKTGFALFSSYNSVVKVDNNATTYILIDPKQLK